MPKEKKIKKKKLGSYSALSVLFSNTLALFVLGLLGLILLVTTNLINIVQDNIELQVFLNKNLSENEVVKIQKTLSVKEYVAKVDGEARIVLTTKEDAAKQFIADTGEDFVSFLGDNPLHDALSLKLNPEYHTKENLKTIQEEIEELRGVYDVAYDAPLIEKVSENKTKISYLLIAIASIFLIAVVVLINNTIKLALFSQRFLIRSMQLVGATASFIRAPFLIRGLGYGAISGIIAMLLILGLLYYSDTYVQKDLLSLVNFQELGILAGILLVIGAFVGYISTMAAVRKYLKMSLDELY